MDFVLLSFASAFLIALGHVLAQFGLRTLSPIKGAGISVPSAALMFLLLSPLFANTAGWTWSAALIFAGIGCLFPAVITLLNFESNRLVGPSLTAALGNFTPVIAVLSGVVLLGALPSGMQMVALAVIVGGISLLLWKPQRLVGDIPMWALALPLGAVVIRGGALAVVKLGFATWPDAYSATTIGYLMSATVLLATKGISERRVPLPKGGRDAWWFALTGISNGLSFLCLYAALARGPIALVAPLVATYPLFAVALSKLIFGTAGVDARGLAGIAITIAGIVLLLGIR